MSSAKLIFTSDFAPIRNFADVMEKTPAAVYGDLLPRLQQADYRIVNLEAPLSDKADYIVKSGPGLSGRPEHFPALEAGNFQAAICANNHTFDCGPEVFFQTKSLLESHGIACVGAGRNFQEAVAPLSIELNGIKIALFAISEGEDMQGAAENKPGVYPWAVDFLAQQIRNARKKYDVILVSSHSGLEFQPYPSFYIYQAFRKWAEAGADLIIGHHPHVPQGMVCFGKCPTYFSLGNFVFDQPTDLFYRRTGYYLEIEAGNSGVLAHRPVPYRILTDRLSLLTGTEAAEFDALFEKLSRPLRKEEDALQAWNAVLAVNGVAGFEQELEKILRNMKECPAKGAAMLRNRLHCIQHFSQWTDGMTRIMEGTISEAPEEYTALVREYLTKKIRFEK